MIRAAALRPPARRCGQARKAAGIALCAWIASAGAAWGESPGGAGARAPARTLADPGAPPPLRTDIRSVPLESIVFDTFGRGSPVPLSEADPGLIEQLRNAIPPVFQPRYQGVAGGAWLAEDDLVLGYRGRQGGAYAYPIKFLNYHEIVHDRVDGVPILVTYCPLCASAMVYDRRVDERPLIFGNTSALHENDLVMFDYQSGSYWFQAAGRAIVGPMTGTRLRLLPSSTVPWGTWRRLHPDTRVLAREQGFAASPDYTQDPFARYPERVARGRFPFPVSGARLDDRLPPATIVVTVAAGTAERAYAPARIGDAAVNDQVGGEPVVVFSRRDGAIAQAYSRRLDHRVLHFEYRGSAFRDRGTGSRWDFGGRAVAGPLAGTRLEPLPSRRAFWFAARLALPELELYRP